MRVAGGSFSKGRAAVEKKGGTNGVLIRAGRPVTQLVLSDMLLRKTFARGLPHKQGFSVAQGWVCTQAQISVGVEELI
jgi:hypothetical protein